MLELFAHPFNRGTYLWTPVLVCFVKLFIVFAFSCQSVAFQFPVFSLIFRSRKSKNAAASYPACSDLALQRGTIKIQHTPCIAVFYWLVRSRFKMLKYWGILELESIAQNHLYLVPECFIDRLEQYYKQFDTYPYHFRSSCLQKYMTWLTWPTPISNVVTSTKLTHAHWLQLLSRELG